MHSSILKPTHAARHTAPFHTLAAAVAALCALASGPTAATNTTWTCGGTQNWANGACWQPAGPGPSDNATLAGNGSASSVVQFNGVHIVNALAVDSPTATALVQLQMAGGLLVAGSAQIGNGHRGSLALQGGALVVNTQLQVGGAAGSVLQTGGTLSAGSVAIIAGSSYDMQAGTLGLAQYSATGLSNQGSFTYGGGTLGNVGLANYGTLKVNASMALDGLGNFGGTVNNLVPGVTLTVNSGGLTNGVNASLGLQGGGIAGSGSINNNDGSISGHGSISGTGVFTNAGTLSVSGGELSFAKDGGLVNKSQLLVQSDGQLMLPGSPYGVTNTGTLRLNGGSIIGDGFVDNSAGGTLKGTGSLYSFTVNRSGASIQAQGGALFFMGEASLASGSFVDLGSTAVAFYGHTSVHGGVNFTGSGQVEFHGTLDFGAAPAHVNLDGVQVLFADSDVLTAKIGGGNAGIDHDRLIGKGLWLNGGLKLVSYDGFVAQAGQSFDLLDWAEGGGTFASIDASGLQLAAGTRLDLSRLYANGTISVTAVPEPATWLMLAAGLLPLWARRRRPA